MIHTTGLIPAFLCFSAWRGLRAPGRLEAVDPAVLRQRADEMPRSEILGRYSLVSTAADYIEIYRPLVSDIHADVVTLQTTSLDQEATIALLGRDVLPELRAMANQPDAS